MVYTADEFAQKVKAKYPEYSGMDNNTLVTKMLEKYPEYQSQVNKPKESFLQSIKKSGQEFLAAPVSLIGGIGNVMENTVGKGMDFVGKKLFGGSYGQVGGTTEKARQTILGEQAGSIPAKIGTFVGEQLPMAGATAGIGTATSLLGRAGIGALEGGVATQLANISSEGKPASLKETVIGAGIGTVLGSSSKLFSNMATSKYKQAFQGTQKGLSEKGYELSGKTPGELVMEQNLSPSVKKGLTQIKDKMSNTRKIVELNADRIGNIQGSAIRGGIKSDILKSLGFDTLNKNTKATKELEKKVNELVNYYVPVGKISGKELVGSIKNLNSTLPDKLKGMGIEAGTSSKSFTTALTKSLKGTLDKAGEKVGLGKDVISSLYTKYSKEALVKSILKDENLRKTLGRQIVGSSAGAVLGGIAGGQSDSGIGGVGIGALLGGIAGKKAQQLFNNPSVLMKVGNVLKTLSKTSGLQAKGAGILSSKINK